MNYDKKYINYSEGAIELYKKFINDFKKYRKENNLTQEVFSKYSNVSRINIIRIESDKHSPCNISFF